MLIEVEVCDVCRRVGVPVASYTITEPGSGRSGVTVRCSDDAAPFEEVLGQPGQSTGPVDEPQSRPAPRPAACAEPKGRRARKVMTLEEIEAAKAAGKA